MLYRKNTRGYLTVIEAGDAENRRLNKIVRRNRRILKWLIGTITFLLALILTIISTTK